jgi:hypothetical protein
MYSRINGEPHTPHLMAVKSSTTPPQPRHFKLKPISANPETPKILYHNLEFKG